MNREKLHALSKRKKILLVVLIAAVLIALCLGAYALLSRLELEHDAAPEGAGEALSREELEAADAALAEELELDTTPLDVDSESIVTLFYNGQQYRYNDELSVLLIIGIDDYDIEAEYAYRNHTQSDFLLLAVFDNAEKTCRLIQVNRDTMTDVPVLGYQGTYIGLANEQIALAYTYGKGLEDSCENTVHAVSRFLYDIPIDNYFTLTMSAVPVLNDLVGGVTVTVEDDFTGVDDSLQKGSTVTLTAENVENFVRSRMSMKDDPTNLNRMRRQRTYMTALFSALSDAAAKSSSFAVDAYDAVSEYMLTDCTVDQLNVYADQFNGYTLSEIVTPEGEAVKGEKYVEFYIDEAALQQLVIDTFYVPVEEE